MTASRDDIEDARASLRRALVDPSLLEGDDLRAEDAQERLLLDFHFLRGNDPAWLRATLDDPTYDAELRGQLRALLPA